MFDVTDDLEGRYSEVIVRRMCKYEGRLGARFYRRYGKRDHKVLDVFTILVGGIKELDFDLSGFTKSRRCGIKKRSVLSLLRKNIPSCCSSFASESAYALLHCFKVHYGIDSLSVLMELDDARGWTAVCYVLRKHGLLK